MDYSEPRLSERALAYFLPPLEAQISLSLR